MSHTHDSCIVGKMHICIISDSHAQCGCTTVFPSHLTTTKSQIDLNASRPRRDVNTKLCLGFFLHIIIIIETWSFSTRRNRRPNIATDLIIERYCHDIVCFLFPGWKSVGIHGRLWFGHDNTDTAHRPYTLYTALKLEVARGNPIRCTRNST